jgi:hypothetical protein
VFLDFSFALALALAFKDKNPLVLSFLYADVFI